MTTLPSLATIMGVPVSAKRLDETTFLIQGSPPPLGARMDYAGRSYRIDVVEALEDEDNIWELTVEAR